jgi:integrase/recombinase XerD
MELGRMMRIEDITNSFYADLELRGIAATTRASMRSTLKGYLEWAEGRDLDPLSADLRLYLAYLREWDYKPSTMRHKFAHLAVFFDYLSDEDIVAQKNPVKIIRRKYLRQYKEQEERRQIISIEEAARMVQATVDSRDRAMLLLFFKTGIRRAELMTLDVEDIDLQKMELVLKPTAKRSNRLIFFDEETARALTRWFKSRETRKRKDPKAAFISKKGGRLESNARGAS